MAKNLLVINVDVRETRVALIEDGIIAELHLERASATGTVGNIVVGKVSRVLPGMQAAFIDVGLERAAFLHVEDLIRPDDFEEYLLGADETERGGTTTRGQGGKSTGLESGRPSQPEDERDEEPEDDEPEEEESAESESDDDDDDDDDDEPEDDEPEDEASGPTDAPAAAPAEALGDGATVPAEAATPAAGTRRRRVVPAADEAKQVLATEEAPEQAEVDASEPTSPFDATASSDEAPDDASEAGPPKPADGVEARVAGGRRRRRRGRGKGGPQDDARPPARGRDDRKRQRGKSSRVARSVPITEVVKEGQTVIVQISKEPIGTKGARVTSHVSLAGRYVVYLPTVEHIGISKRIGSAGERQRLRKTIEGLLPSKGGLIVRTVAEGLTKKQLKSDIAYLIKAWQDVSKKAESAKWKDVLYTELDLVLKTARDLFSDSIDQIVIDDKEQYQRLRRFMEAFMPERLDDVLLYSGEEPIFDAFGIEDEIARALSRKVPLQSGGYLILDQAEALTAIDVNTGRFVGKGSKDLEETALKTNLEAVQEIAYQLRFRNIGGLIILDLIDMDKASNRDKVLRSLEKLLANDKAKTTLQRISELGLVEMTRKRTRESLGRLLHQPCFYCDGTGQVQSRETIGYEILRQIRRERGTLQGYSVHVNAHPAIVDLLKNEEKTAVEEIERRLMRRIEFTPRREYHIEQFDLQGK